MGASRILICGRLFEPGRGGGLELALGDLATALAAAGWETDLAVTPAALDLESRVEARIRGLGASKWSSLPRLRFLPEDVRAILQHMLLDGGFAQAQSELMSALEARLKQREYKAVIACVPREAPGIARFITETHPNVLLLSLDGLGGELRRAGWLALPRLVARVVQRRKLHPALYRPVDPRRARLAVFASEAWRDEAVRAGLPESVCRTIHFGLDHVPPLPPPTPVRGRLLWVGRLSREKGLHYFIEAMAVLRRTRAVRLDAICGPGPADYRRAIERRIAELDLQDVVHLRPPVPREALLTAYRAHDALLFHSVFAEPVALVTAEAFAAGLTVVAPAPRRPSALIRPGETACCFDSPTAGAIAGAVERALADAGLRDRLRTAAHRLVEREFSLDAMGSAYDAALLGLLNSTAS